MGQVKFEVHSGTIFQFVLYFILIELRRMRSADRLGSRRKQIFLELVQVEGGAVEVIDDTPVGYLTVNRR